jgi:predicted amidophosphoribosyltransferase
MTVRYCPSCKIETKHLRCPMCGRETDDDSDNDPDVEALRRERGYTIFEHAQYPEKDDKIKPHP